MANIHDLDNPGACRCALPSGPREPSHVGDVATCSHGTVFLYEFREFSGCAGWSWRRLSRWWTPILWRRAKRAIEADWARTKPRPDLPGRVDPR